MYDLHKYEQNQMTTPTLPTITPDATLDYQLSHPASNNETDVPRNEAHPFTNIRFSLVNDVVRITIVSDLWKDKEHTCLALNYSRILFSKLHCSVNTLSLTSYSCSSIIMWCSMSFGYVFWSHVVANKHDYREWR